MPLSPGTHLGPYEIIGALGAGGMGEVYRASDARLAREVAIKILSQEFASSAERMARFSREAQVLAALNHSSIAHVYGLEESDGTRALVMELVDGPTLAERIALGRLPIEDALRIAKQIAEALEYAHERGIIHRDLKPANVKVTPEGNVKILDFGLAKALDDSPASASLNTSPTLSMAATQAGLILGTAAYMSPEQARGKAVDRRADIWAFGAVLFEMLSRKQAFEGEDTSQVMAAVIMKVPEWSQLPAALPNSIRNLVQRCLTKDPTLRLQAIGEARIAIDRVLSGAQDEGAVTATAPIPAWRKVLPWALAALLLTALGVYVWAPWRGVETSQPVRLSVQLGADTYLQSGPGSALALSPDGKMLAFTGHAAVGANSELFLRRLDQTAAIPITGTEGARDPFFSPDGLWVAFFIGATSSQLMKVPVSGGAVTKLCDAIGSRGGSWGDDGNIVFASADGGLKRVLSEGGAATDLANLDVKSGETSHRWPQVLPGARVVLYTSQTKPASSQDANIVALTLTTGQRKLIRGGATYARFLPDRSGHKGFLLFVHEATIFAARFDAERIETTGEAVPVVDGVSEIEPTGSGQFAVSANGTLVYQPGRNRLGAFEVDWVTQEGKTETLTKGLGTYRSITVSPDGQRLAMDVIGVGEDIWVYETKRGTMSRLTFGGGSNSNPAWTADGLRIAFSSNRERESPGIYWQRADGTGEVQRLTEGNSTQVPWSWHPTGKFLAYGEQHTQTQADIMILPMEGSESMGWKAGQPYSFLNGTSTEGEARFSPDGNWLAYQSDESGIFQIYVRPFPGPGGKWQISTDSGLYPTWVRDKHELLYQQGDGKVMVMEYALAGGVFQPGKPRQWGPVKVPVLGRYRAFDVTADGKRVAVRKATDEPQPEKQDHVTLVLNFGDQLKRVAPGKR